MNEQFPEKTYKELSHQEKAEFTSACLNEVESEMHKLLDNTPIFTPLWKIEVGMSIEGNKFVIKGSVNNTVRFDASLLTVIDLWTNEETGLKPTISAIFVPMAYQNQPEHWGSAIVKVWENTLKQFGFNKSFVSNVSNIKWWTDIGYSFNEEDGWYKKLI